MAKIKKLINLIDLDIGPLFKRVDKEVKYGKKPHKIGEMEYIGSVNRIVNMYKIPEYNSEVARIKAIEELNTAKELLLPVYCKKHNIDLKRANLVLVHSVNNGIQYEYL